jgi:putative acetyltransferase
MLRLATEQDFDLLYSLYMHPVINRWLLYEDMPREAFRPIAMELIQRSALYVFEAEGEALAMCKLVPQKYRNSHIIYLGGVAVDPGRQRQGIGARMLAAVIAECRRRGCTRIELTVSVENPRAIRLYESVGFVSEGILKNYCYLAQEGRYMDEQVMALLLTR